MPDHEKINKAREEIKERRGSSVVEEEAQLAEAAGPTGSSGRKERSTGREWNNWDDEVAAETAANALPSDHPENTGVHHSPTGVTGVTGAGDERNPLTRERTTLNDPTPDPGGEPAPPPPPDEPLTGPTGPTGASGASAPTGVSGPTGRTGSKASTQQR